MSRSVAILTDQFNTCLRAVNLQTGQTSLYAGRCTVRGTSDGKLLSEARFYYPESLVLHKRDLYIADSGNDAIRVIREGHDHVTTVAQGGMLHQVRRMRIDQFSTNDVAYITTNKGLLQLDLNTRTVKRLTHGSGLPGSLSATESFVLGGLTFVTDSILFITASWKNQLMVADLARDKVIYICDGKPDIRNGDIKTCSFKLPRSILVKSGLIYIGEYGTIRRFPFNAINHLIPPTDAIGK